MRLPPATAPQQSARGAKRQTSDPDLEGIEADLERLGSAGDVTVTTGGLGILPPLGPDDADMQVTEKLRSTHLSSQSLVEGALHSTTLHRQAPPGHAWAHETGVPEEQLLSPRSPRIASVKMKGRGSKARFLVKP